MFYSFSDINDTFRILNKHNINYVLLHNIDEELPYKLKYGKDIDILVHPADWERYLKIMSQFDFSELIHPHGIEVGWIFLYGMVPCRKFEHRKTGVQIDVYAQLATKSIDRDAWLPLDKSIQESIWRDKVWDEEHRWWRLNDENLLIHLVTRSIFEKETFTEGYIREIEKLKYLLQNESEAIENKMNFVFFKFTPNLMKMLLSGDYANIRKRYLAFSDY